MRALIVIVMVAMLMGCSSTGTIIPKADGTNISKHRAQDKETAEKVAMGTAQKYCEGKNKSYAVNEYVTAYDGPGTEDAHRTVNTVGNIVGALGAPGLIRSDGGYLCTVSFTCL